MALLVIEAVALLALDQLVLGSYILLVAHYTDLTHVDGEVLSVATRVWGGG